MLCLAAARPRGAVIWESSILRRDRTFAAAHCDPLPEMKSCNDDIPVFLCAAEDGVTAASGECRLFPCALPHVAALRSREVTRPE